jgi:hypothetical protein
MEELAFPEWPATSDEQPAESDVGFEQCEAMISLLAQRMNSTVADRKYSISKKWGRILRAKIIMGFSAPRVSCWTGSGAGAQIFIEFEGFVPRQAEF